MIKLLECHLIKGFLHVAKLKDLEITSNGIRPFESKNVWNGLCFALRNMKLQKSPKLSLCALMLGTPFLAGACPFCNTVTSEIVRSGIKASLLEPISGLSVLLPFVVLMGLLRALEPRTL